MNPWMDAIDSKAGVLWNAGQILTSLDVFSCLPLLSQLPRFIDQLEDEASIIIQGILGVALSLCCLFQNIVHLCASSLGTLWHKSTPHVSWKWTVMDNIGHVNIKHVSIILSPRHANRGWMHLEQPSSGFYVSTDFGWSLNKQNEPEGKKSAATARIHNRHHSSCLFLLQEIPFWNV